MNLQRQRTASLAAVFAALALAGPSFLMGQSPKAVQGSKVVQKWMTGDWHQHTFFTDGTNFMGDVEIDFSATPPTFRILTDKYTSAAPGFAPVREGAGGRNEYKGGMAQGFRFGLDFQANSEHGGNRGSHDGYGRFWNDSVFYPMGTAGIPLLGAAGSYNNGCSYLAVDSPSCGGYSAPVMWRWQELANYPSIVTGYGDNFMSAFDWITALRSQFTGKEVLTGMEWNVPGHEHASTGCLENDGKCIAEFEYRFDQNDTDDTAGPAAAGMAWTGKIQTSAYVAPAYPDYYSSLGLKPAHAKAIAGLQWLNDSHPNTSWVNIAHIERAGCGFGSPSSSGYSIAALRDMNDTAPTVFFGFEGMPGHQKAANRGEFSSSACGGGTYGGAGKYIATVGGVWDNLLADGRKVFNFVSSDFHITQDDFYPGEYAKTYVNVKHDLRQGEGFTQQDILDALRSGNSFAVHGDLINDLDFRAFHGGSIKNQSATNYATMGQTLVAERGDKITLQIRFKSPATNNCGLGAECAAPVVHHIQLIQGRVNPTRATKFLASGDPNPDYNAIDNAVAEIVGTFDASSWATDAEGFTTMTFTVPYAETNMFFRIRGTNLGYNVSSIGYGTDEGGSPLLNPPGTNKAARAWNDLWFYSNPIFVSVRQ